MTDHPTLTAFARECLQHIPTASKKPEKYRFRNRFTHTLRVMKWCERLLEEVPADSDVVMASAALHDIGYTVSAQDHALHGAIMAENFLREKGYEESFLLNVSDLISRHSDKRLPTEKMSNELIILQDADCLDEIGALTVLWDAMAEGAREEQSYEATLQRIEDSYASITARNRSLKSAYGQALYLERLDVLRRYIEDARYELFL